MRNPDTCEGEGSSPSRPDDSPARPGTSAPPHPEAPTEDVHPETGRSALAVGGGILVSRVTGFVRDVVIGYFFGTGIAVDAYNVALRIPNVVRNLLGEGTLSASFVPVYSSMLEAREEAATRRLARAVLGVVLALAALLSALGVLLAPLLVRLLVPEWEEGPQRLTTTLLQILFPMAGVMIVAAWCLGVLNSHRRFFLPFSAPALWNLAQIGGLLLGWWAGWEPLIYVLAVATLVGSLLQLAVQVPAVVRLAGGFRPTLDWGWEPVRRVVRNAGPVISSQGIFQISSLVDVFLAGFLAHGALAGLYYAQRLAYLPLSLFGISVAAASLPEMSREREAQALRRRLVDGFHQILYFVFPVAVAFILFGDLLVSVLFQRGEFGVESTHLVAAVLLAYALGLVATSSVKLFASGFHAVQDTATPMKLAAVSTAVGIASGAGFMFWLDARGFGAMAVSGLIAGGALGAWLNLSLLWWKMAERVGGLFRRGDLLAVVRIGVAGLVGGLVGVLARGWLTETLAGAGLAEADFAARALLLAGTLLAAGVPYLAIAGTPPGSTGSHNGAEAR